MYMKTCVTILGRLLGHDTHPLDSLSDGIIRVHATATSESILIVINDVVQFEILEPCATLSGGKPVRRRRSTRSRRKGKKRTRGRRRGQKGAGRTYRSRTSSVREGDILPVGSLPIALLKLIGMFFLFIYVEYVVRIRPTQRTANILSQEQFAMGDVLSYMPKITGVSLTGNISSPKLLQVLEHTGSLSPALRPVAVPSLGAPSFIEAKFPRESATSLLAKAQTQVPHLARKHLTLGPEQNTMYVWAVNWKVVGRSVEVDIRDEDLNRRGRERTGTDLGNDLTSLVVRSLQEQLTTMARSGLLRQHEKSGTASLSLINFVPGSGVLPENMKPDSYHRDGIPDYDADANEQYSKRAILDNPLDTIYGPTHVNVAANSTMIRKTALEQIMTFTYEEGVLETSVRALLEDDDGRKVTEDISFVSPGQSSTVMVDQRSGLLHKGRQVPYSTDRYAILVNVMPLAKS